MTHSRSRAAKIWLGVGAAAVTSTTGAMASPQATSPDLSDKSAPRGGPYVWVAQSAAPAPAAPAHDHGATATQGGEGGESGAAANMPATIKFLRDIGLIRGHLLVGDELVQLGRWEDGQPHFLHPVEEIYEAIRRPLKEKHIADFDGALKALAQTVKAKKTEAYKQALARVDARLSEIETAERAAAAGAWAPTIVATVVALSQSAAGEYSGAIEDGRITKPVEYQDSRGFVFYGAKLLASVDHDLKTIDAEGLANLNTVYGALKLAWPAPLPPEAPVLDPAGVLAAVSRFELAASPFVNR